MQDTIDKLKEEILGVRTLLNAREKEIEKIKCEIARLTKDYDLYGKENTELRKQVSKLKCTIKNIAELI